MFNPNYDDLKEINIDGEIFEKYLSAEQINIRVEEIAESISRDFKDKTPVLIGVLNGAFVFMSDLIKKIKIDCEIDFFKLSSYGDSKISSGQVKKIKDLNCDIKGRNVVIIEDIVDTGLSINYIEKLLAEHNPAQVALAALLCKPNSLKYKPKIDYIGFNIPSKFVVGYGLDHSQKYRNLRSIYILKG